MAVTETTPYDAERARFTREALARLVLCDEAVDVADSAGGLVATGNDPDCGPGGRVSQALRLVELAERALASAVVYERERGSSWADIARYLGTGAAEAEARFAAHLTEWDTAFTVPYRLDETGRKRLPRLPPAAYDPEDARTFLDRWALLRHIGIDDRQAVSRGLRMATPNEDTPPATS